MNDLMKLALKCLPGTCSLGTHQGYNEGITKQTYTPHFPSNMMFLPLAMRDHLIQMDHTAPSSGHPGIQQTITHLVTNSSWISTNSEVMQ